MDTNVYSENCPADKVREYIEKIIRLQKECLISGREVPDDLAIPSRIELSPENIKFLINSQLVDFIGTGKDGDEINFYWKSTEKLPALEVRTKLDSDGKYYLTYIREEASEEKPAFEWDVNSQEGKKGKLIVSKVTDALEDVTDMGEFGRKL